LKNGNGSYDPNRSLADPMAEASRADVATLARHLLVQESYLEIAEEVSRKIPRPGGAGIQHKEGVWPSRLASVVNNFHYASHHHPPCSKWRSIV